MATADLNRCARISIVIGDVLTGLMRDLMDHGKPKDPKELYRILLKSKFYQTKLTPQEKHALQYLEVDGFKRLDITLMYKIARYFRDFFEPPSRNWNATPLDHETTVGDDIERIRQIRNHYSHNFFSPVTEEEMETFFKTFTEVGQRIDRYLNKTGESSYEMRILQYKECSLDSYKEINAQNVNKHTIEVEVTDDITCSLTISEETYNVIKTRCKIDSEGTIPCRLHIHGIDDQEGMADKLNTLKDDINNKSENIKIDKAIVGSLVFYLKFQKKLFVDQALLYKEIEDFIRLIFCDMMTGEETNVYAIITLDEDEEDIEYSSEDEDSDLTVVETEDDDKHLLINLDVKSNIFSTTSSIERHFGEFFKSMSALMNGRQPTKKKDVFARIDVINENVSLEEENYVRLCMLMTTAVPVAVRFVLDNEFAQTIQPILNCNRIKLETLHMKGVINNAQWSLLFPRKDTASSKNFDLTLMICLLRHLSNFEEPQTGFDRLPPSTDTSLEADLARIQYYRHVLTLTSDTTITSEEFDVAWMEISKAIGRLGGQTIVQLCNILRDSCICYPNDKQAQEPTIPIPCIRALREHLSDKAFVEIRDQYKREMEKLKQEKKNKVTKDQIDIQNKELLKMRRQLERFFVTNAASYVYEKVKKYQCVVITGKSGTGKSSVAFYAGFSLEDKEGYTLIPVARSSDVIKLSIPDTKQAFLLDDCMGKYSLDQLNFNCWQNERKAIKTLLQQNSKLKLIMTFRSNIFDEIKSYLDLSFSNCDLHSNALDLSLDERKEISKIYISENMMNHISDEILLKTELFPLLCSICKNDVKVEDFFKAPFATIAKDIAKMKIKSQQSYFALALLVILNNKFEKLSFSKENAKLNEICNDLCLESNLQCCLTQESIMIGFDNLKSKMYVKETENCFSFSHDKMFDIASNCIGKYFLQTILKHSDSSFISDRLQFQSICKPYDEFAILIKNEPEDLYYSRLMSDLELGCNWQVFGNIQTKYPEYRKVLINFFRRQNSCSIKFIQCNLDSSTALHVSAFIGYYDFAEFILEVDPKQLNMANNEGRTPLHIACLRGNAEIVKLFIKYQAQINQMDNENYTPLSLACISGHLNLISLLLENIASVNLCDKKGMTPLHYASCRGDVAIIELLINSGASVNQFNKIGATALHEASLNGHTESVFTLIKYGARVNKKMHNGTTPLHIVCAYGFYNVAIALLQNAANVNERNMYGVGPIHVASTWGYKQIIELLLKYKVNVDMEDQYGMTALHLACHEGRLSIVSLLLTQKADANKTNQDGWTPIFIACMKNQNEIVKRLLSFNAVPNVLTNNGSTPLGMASKNGNKQLVSELIRHGAKLNEGYKKSMQLVFDWTFKEMTRNTHLCNEILSLAEKVSQTNIYILKAFLNFANSVIPQVKWTPLHEASNTNKTDVADILLQSNRKLIDQGIDQWGSPLFFACQENNIDVAELLLRNNAAVNKKNMFGKTPLFAACENGHHRIAALLFQFHANADETDNSKCTPLYKACLFGHKTIVEVLLTNGASVNKSISEGLTPILVTCYTGKEDIFNILLRYGVDLNPPLPFNKWTPLHSACKSGNINIVNNLIQRNVEIFPEDSYGRTPLYIACEFGFDKIVQRILTESKYHDPSNHVNKGDIYGNTPVHIACQEGRLGVVKLLTEYAAINKVNNEGCSALYIACQKGHCDIVSYLLSQHAHVDMADSDGKTPLYIACQNGNIDVAEVLIKNHASVNNNYRNSTPLHVACINGYRNLVLLLLKHDAKINRHCVHTSISNKTTEAVAEILLQNVLDLD